MHFTAKDYVNFVFLFFFFFPTSFATLRTEKEPVTVFKKIKQKEKRKKRGTCALPLLPLWWCLQVKSLLHRLQQNVLFSGFQLIPLRPTVYCPSATKAYWFQAIVAQNTFFVCFFIIFCFKETRQSHICCV